jgi:lyso-ornithine lipid O-acyltransferase
MKSGFLTRSVRLALTLGAAVVRYWMLRMRGAPALEARARWLQETCVRVLRSLEIRCVVEGEIPERGLVVANHLSYLDIAILSATMPCFFVAKLEIASWPYFGKAARAGGTLFIDRTRRASADKVAQLMGDRLKLPVKVLLFPEGTSTNGTTLRFHSGLFEPAVRAGAPITPAAIRYVMDDGTPESELCWFGDDALLPHLLKTLRTAGFHAKLRFGTPRIHATRRVAAEETFAEVAAMRSEPYQRGEPVRCPAGQAECEVSPLVLRDQGRASLSR